MLKRSSSEERHHLEDKGWQAMRLMLNREMPVRRKRKPILWWPWGIAAAIVIAAGLFWMNADDGGQSINGVALEKTFGSQQESEPSASQDLTERPRGEEEISTVEINPEIEVAQKDKELIRSNLTSQKNLGKSSGSDQEHHQPLVGDLQRKTDSHRDDHVSDPVEQVRNSDSYADRAEEEVEISLADIKRVPSSLAMLSLRDGHVAHLPYPISLPQMATVEEGNEQDIQIRRRLQWDVGVGSGLLADTRLSHLSWDALATLRLKPLKRWALGLGVAFWQVRKKHTIYYDPSISNRFNLNDGDLSIDFASEPERFDTAGQQGVVSGISRFELDIGSYLRVPIFVQYNPKGRWQPHLGVTPIFLIEKQTVQQEIPQFSGGQSQPLSDLRREQNLAVDVGVTYVIADRFRLQLSYLHGFHSHLTQEVRGSFANLHRTLRLSTEYKF